MSCYIHKSETWVKFFISSIKIRWDETPLSPLHVPPVSLLRLCYICSVSFTRLASRQPRICSPSFKPPSKELFFPWFLCLGSLVTASRSGSSQAPRSTFSLCSAPPWPCSRCSTPHFFFSRTSPFPFLRFFRFTDIESIRIFFLTFFHHFRQSLVFPN